LAGGLHELGGVVGELGDRVEKRRLLEQAIQHQRAALAINPRVVQYRRFMRNHYHELTKVLVELDDHAEAARRVDEMVGAELPEQPDEPGFIAYIAAFHLVRCVLLAGQDKRLSADQREQAITTYGKRADALIQMAASRGANSPKVLAPLANLILSLSPDAAPENAMALGLARRAVELDSKEPRHLQLLGLAEYRNGHSDAAVQAIEKGAEVRGRVVPCDWLVLALAHARQGEMGKARDWYAKVRPLIDEGKDLGDTPRWLIDAAVRLFNGQKPESPDESTQNPKTGSGSK
jgi:tetratricopeptide (TPR) repeat protein